MQWQPAVSFRSRSDGVGATLVQALQQRGICAMQRGDVEGILQFGTVGDGCGFGIRVEDGGGDGRGAVAETGEVERMPAFREGQKMLIHLS